MTFDALLKARLVEVKARNAFSWFSAPGIMRLGAATAGGVIILFAAQYNGLFSDKQKPASVEQAAVTAPLTPGQRVDPQPTITSPLSVDTVASGPKHYYSQRARVAVERDRTAPDTRFTAEDGGSGPSVARRIHFDISKLTLETRRTSSWPEAQLHFSF